MEDRWKTAKPAEELKEKEQRYSIDSCMTMVMISLHENKKRIVQHLLLYFDKVSACKISNQSVC